MAADVELPFRVRPAVPDDSAAVARVHAEARHAAYRDILSAADHAAMNGADLDTRWRSRLSTPVPRSHVHVAVAGGQAIGIVSGGPTRHAHVPFDAEVYALYVQPAWQRRGVGRALIAASRDALGGAGFHNLVLGVLASNHRARRFYAAAGGRPVGAVTVRIGGGRYTEVLYGWTHLDEVAPGAGEHVRLRRAREQDAFAVYEVHRRAITEICAGFYSGAEIRNWLAGLVPGGHLPAIVAKDFTVAVSHDRIVGFSEFDGVTREVSAVYVDPDLVRRGVGSRLLRAAETAARGHGITHVHLHATLNAVPFYVASGYTLDSHGLVPLRAGGALRCGLMRRALPPLPDER